ncbi:MAG: nicotinic acid mononucleotide adenylyltransferase, partial [Planctomycetaceae bacterium]
MPPHKRDRTLAPAGDAFEVSTVEIDRGGVSWTVDTLVTLAALHPAAELRLILGPDALADLP